MDDETQVLTREEVKANLTLISSQNLTADLAYGIVFNVLADEIETIKERALSHYQAATKYGVDPSRMGADLALEELGLADRSNISTIDGSPVFNYLPSFDGECDCDDDGDYSPA